MRGSFVKWGVVGSAMMPKQVQRDDCGAVILVTLNLFQGPFLHMLGGVKQPCVYILASQPHGTLYIGVTSDLLARLYQHRSGEVKGFTSRYSVMRLVRFEQFETMAEAIAREKQLKRWHRQWKVNLIESENPDWHDLAVGFGFAPVPSP